MSFNCFCWTFSGIWYLKIHRLYKYAWVRSMMTVLYDNIYIFDKKEIQFSSIVIRTKLVSQCALQARPKINSFIQLIDSICNWIWWTTMLLTNKLYINYALPKIYKICAMWSLGIDDLVHTLFSLCSRHHAFSRVLI